MMRSLKFCIFFFLVACSHTAERPRDRPNDRQVAFVSKQATEAVLTFSHRVEMVSRKKPSKAEALEQVESQVQHLFGPMERADYIAAPKEDHTIRITSISEKSDGSAWEIFYDYEGTIVLQKGPRKYYDVLLPINPSTIYASAMARTLNPCTDEHYQSEGDFWYFWSPAPAYPKCKLKEGEHYEVVRANIERIDIDRKSTYPEYERLADKNGVIDIHLFFGMDDAQYGHNPYKSKDINAENYVKTKEALEAMGFKVRRWEKDEIAKIAKKIGRQKLPFIEEATKEYSVHTIRVRLFFGETGIDEKSAGFHYFFRDSLQNSSIMVYDGHSGLGGHLDLDSIADARGFRISPNKDRYQIYFFNSCTSYTYYNALYFQKKHKGGRKRVDPKGTKNLDILANGLSTAFDSMHNTDMTLVKAIDLWATRGTWTSYQRMAKEIDSENLFTVNGDEDNPKRPGGL